jgi:recombination protein RecA
VPTGRLLELSGALALGRTTSAVALVAAAQRRDEPVAWVQPKRGALFPPDLADAGIDLDALVVVHTPREGGGHGVARAAELLMRSGAFGLAVLDLTDGTPPGDAWLGRLGGLARQHEARIAILTSRRDEEPSVGPLVGLRVAPARDRRAPGRFVIEHRVLKDKLGLPTGVAPARHRAPPGLG